MRFIERSIILIGPDDSGKKTFVDSLGLLESGAFKTNYVSSTRKPFFNLSGKKSDETYEILVPFNSNDFDAIKLKILICRSIDFNSDKNLEDIYNLSEYSDEFQSIFYFSGGVDVRVYEYNRDFLSKLACVYGDSIFGYLTIIQSFSNKIEYYDDSNKYTSCNTKEEIKSSKEEIDNFYKKRTESRRNQFYEILKTITSQNNTKFPNCENFERYQRLLLNKIAYLDFGKVEIKNSENVLEPSLSITLSTVPVYPDKFILDYNVIFKKGVESDENYIWIDRFKERIFSLDKLFSFSEIDKEIKEIKKKEKEIEMDNKLSILALEKAEKVFENSEKYGFLKSALINVINSVPIAIKHSNAINPFSNNSILSSLSEMNNYSDITNILKIVNDNYIEKDTESEKFVKFMNIFESEKAILKVQSHLGMIE